MGYQVQFSRTPDIVVSGSILGNLRYKNTKIWGAGFHFDTQNPRIKNPNLYYAVRGKLSLNILKNKLNFTSNISLGDPGLLLSRFFKPKTKKEFDICIVSHYWDYHFFMKSFSQKYHIINMGSNDIEKIANSINKCNFVFSSSLHGIIFSHSLGIPSVHLENLMLCSKKNFKFKDYFSVLKIPYTKEKLKNNNFLYIVKKYKKKRYKYLPKKTIIKQIQDSLLSSFPFKKND